MERDNTADLPNFTVEIFGINDLDHTDHPLVFSDGTCPFNTADCLNENY